MKVKLELDLQDGRGTRTMITNMFVVCEWEKLETAKSLTAKVLVTATLLAGRITYASWLVTLCRTRGANGLNSIPTWT